MIVTTWTGPGTERHHLEELSFLPHYLEMDQLREKVKKRITVAHHRREDDVQESLTQHM